MSLAKIIIKTKYYSSVTKINIKYYGNKILGFIRQVFDKIKHAKYYAKMLSLKIQEIFNKLIIKSYKKTILKKQQIKLNKNDIAYYIRAFRDGIKELKNENKKD